MRVLSDVNEIGRIAANFDAISFDIFDTLLFRNVPEPQDVFVVTSEIAVSRGLRINGFPELRKKAEKQAAANLPANSDTTLELIYAQMPLSDEDRAILKSCELEAEQRLLVANGPMVELANRLLAMGKTVVATSDMYLGSDFLIKVLEKNGFVPSKLYVSSEVGLRKSRGKLFEYVLDDLGLEPSRVLHIGDNRISDGLMPKRLGIASVLYKRAQLHDGRLAGIPVNASELVMHALSARAYSMSAVSYGSVGYSFFGPLLVGMCQWIKAEKDLRPERELHFLSRDGYILHKIFSVLYPNETARYSYVSRRSLTVPLLTDITSFRDVLQAVPYIKRHETMASLFEKVGLDDACLLKSAESRYGAEINRVDILDGKLDSLFEDLKEPMQRNAARERALLDGYLTQEFEGESILVDVGWYGTIQSCLARATGKDEIGLYLGLLRHNPEYSFGEAKGYAYDYINGDSFDSSLVFSFNGLAETFFTAPHGSVRRYEKKDDGTYGPVFAETEVENADAVAEIQQGALRYAKDYAAGVGGLSLSPASSAYAFCDMERLLTTPTRDEVALFGSLWFYDASYDPLVCLGSATGYLRNPKQLARDFLRSNWKAGWLRSFVPSGKFARGAYLAMNKAKGKQ